MLVQLKGVWSYNYRVYGCTTIRVVVVRLKGVVTRLGRPADCSRQTCWLGSAELLSLVATFEKQSLSTRKPVSFNSKSSLFKLKKTFLWTQRNVSFRLFNHILSLIQTSEYAYSIIFFRLFNHLNTLIQSYSSAYSIIFLRQQNYLLLKFLQFYAWILAKSR